MYASFRVAPAVLALAAILTGCGGAAAGTGSDPNNLHQVEVATWWTDGNEKLGYQAMTTAFGNAEPGIELIDASVRGDDGERARQAIATRLESGNPPDSFLALGGAGLAGYVADGDLVDLTDWFADEGLVGRFRPDLLELLGVDGRYYAVPAAIHRVNVVWVNDAVLDAAGVDGHAPADLEAWLADLERVRSSGVEYPLAVGARATQLQLFESVLLARLGAEGYAGLWSDAAGWDAPGVRDAIDLYGRILEYANPRGLSRDATATTRAVIAGTSGYVVMADTAHAVFQTTGWTWGVEFTTWPVPGTDGVFDIGADVFTLPSGAVHGESARAWLRSVASVETQQVLNYKLGSLPGRLDADPTQLWPYQRDAVGELREDVVVPSIAYGAAAPPAWAGAIEDAVAKFGGDRKPAALANALAAAAREALGS